MKKSIFVLLFSCVSIEAAINDLRLQTQATATLFTNHSIPPPSNGDNVVIGWTASSGISTFSKWTLGDGMSLTSGVLTSSMSSAIESDVADMIQQFSDDLVTSHTYVTPVEMATALSIFSGTLAPLAFSGSYTDLSGTPTIPTNTNQLTNGSGYITGITSGNVTSALGFTPYNATNPNGYTTNTGTVTSIIAGTGLSGGTITTSGTLSLPNVGTAGSYGLITTDEQGRVSAVKKHYTYSGVTNSSGDYSVTFSPITFGATPNIQANVIGGTDLYRTTISSVSSTGFTVHVVIQNTNTILGIVNLVSSTTAVNGASIQALITEN